MAKKAALRSQPRGRSVIGKVLTPVQELIRTESASGILLIAAAVLAFAWANSPWSASYFAVLEVRLDVGVGGWSLEKSLLLWVNDLLMAVFFFLIGLEIKREVLVGELAGWQRAVLPVAGALGGMIVPALIYIALNLGQPTLRGWGGPQLLDSYDTERRPIGLRAVREASGNWRRMLSVGANPGLLEPGYLMQARMRQAAVDTLRQMHAVVHLHPAPEAPAPPFRDLLGGDAAAAAGVPVLVAYTKGDLVQPDARRRLEAGGAVVLSSTTGEGLPAMLDRLEPLLPEGPFDYDPGDLGVQPLRFFVVEYLREAAFENLGDELPYSFAAEVEEFREHERPVYIRATLFVERESQKGMVVGKGGRMVKAIGQHARSRLEGLLGDPVYLDLRVKVLARWRRSAAALTRFGFPPAPQESP